MISIITSFHECMSAKVVVGKYLTAPFDTCNGFRQRCAMVPVLLIIQLVFWGNSG